MLASIGTLVAAAYLAGALVVLARRKPGYSHIKHTISELGERGAPDERLVAVGVFLPVGLAMLGVAFLSYPAHAPLAALAACIAVGYGGAAIFPCDPGSPTVGSARQGAHNLAGAVEYIGGGFALITIAETYGDAFKLLGFAVLAATAVLSLAPANPVRGLVQRVAELCLFGGLAWAAWLASAG